MREFPIKKKLHALIIALVLLALPLGALAQLYTWRDAQGNVIIKNTPPPWYNESERSRGARVQVLRNGKVIDDTAWPADKRQEGRNTDARQEEKRVRPENAAPPGKKEDDDDN
jgi:Domain of unknown function (DUF4124)